MMATPVCCDKAVWFGHFDCPDHPQDKDKDELVEWGKKAKIAIAALLNYPHAMSTEDVVIFSNEVLNTIPQALKEE